MKRKVSKFIFLFIFLFCTSGLLFAQQKNLNDYIQSAIKFSPVFADNQNQLQSLALDSLLVRAGLKPQIGFVSNDMYAPVVNGYGYDDAITNGANVNALLGIKYLFNGKRNLSNQFGALNIQKEILAINLKLTERDLKQSVSQQYITVYGEQLALKNAEELIALLGKEETILKQLTQSAVYAQTDYLTFLVNYNQQKLNYAQQLLQSKNDFYTLNYLCGIADTTYLNLPLPEISLTENYSVTQSISFQKFVYDSLRIENSLQKIQFNYKPKLSLLGDAGYNSSLAVHPEKNFGASVGLNFSVPIYDGRQRNLQQQKFSLEQNSNQNSRNYFVSQYNIRKAQLKNQIAATEKLLNDSQAQLELTKTLMHANEQLLITSDLRIADYLLAVYNFISAQSTVSQLHADKLQLINQYNFFIQ